jgi:hypothetical protein
LFTVAEEKHKKPKSLLMVEVIRSNSLSFLASKLNFSTEGFGLESFLLVFVGIS